jgi:hypothetical protein
MIVYFPTGFHDAGIHTLGLAQAWFSSTSQDVITAHSLEYTCSARTFDYTAPARLLAYDTRPRVLDFTPPSPR